MKTIVGRYEDANGHTRFTVSFVDGSQGAANHSMTFIASLTPGELAVLERAIVKALDLTQGA